MLHATALSFGGSAAAWGDLRALGRFQRWERWLASKGSQRKWLFKFSTHRTKTYVASTPDTGGGLELDPRIRTGRPDASRLTSAPRLSMRCCGARANLCWTFGLRS